MQRHSSSNYGSEQGNRRDFEKACKGAHPQFEEASKQTDVTSKRHAKELVLKLRKRANKQMRLRKGTQWRLSSNYGSEQTNKRDFKKKREGARPQIMDASKLDPEGACTGACRLFKDASKQTDVTSKRHEKALVLRLRKQASKQT